MNTTLNNVVLAVHGGTGIERSKLNPVMESEYREALRAALQAGYQQLRDGHSAVMAVEAAVRSLEDCPLFNAGRGAVFTHDGRNELDAAIMEGSGRNAGAVAMVTCLRNPISAARAVMEKSPHVLLVGPGAENFAIAQGVEKVDPIYFRTERRWQELQRALAGAPKTKFHEWSTVGAVALDSRGLLAAATSTGGMTDKFPGRVGDSPLIAAGTYADNASCAVSCTGHGEYFIRFAAAHEIASQVKHGGRSVAEAADDVIHKQLGPAGGEGGVIALDRHGRLAMPYNSPGLYRGAVTGDGTISVALYDS